MFRVLGRVAVVVDGREHVLGSTREAALLADLLVHANQVVASDLLIDDVWRGEPPPGAVATLHTYVKNLRRVLGPDRETGVAREVLVTRRPGYQLRVETDGLDAWRGERLIGEGRARLAGGDAARAEALLREALALWTGPAFGELAHESYVRAEAARLEELRLVGFEERVQAGLALGHHTALCGELDALVSEHPYRERLWEQWMLALYRAGRQADALRAYQRVRRLLGDELGIEPGEPLRRLEQAILLQTPALDWTPPPQAPLGTRREHADVDHRRAMPVVPRRSRCVTGRAATCPRAPQLFGRSEAIDEIEAFLHAKRLVSLVGVGGVGKTSLALAVAHAARDRYPDGVWYVELAPVGDPDNVASVIAGAFGHQEQSGLTVVESLRRLLARKELLLVLDNCEHVLEAAASFVEQLLRVSKSVDVLLTSREGLGIPREHQIAVAPLPTHGPDSPAVQLFAARAAQIVDSFELDETNSDDVVAICRDLDGLPLAIELVRHGSAACRLESCMTAWPTGSGCPVLDVVASSGTRPCVTRSGGRTTSSHRLSERCSTGSVSSWGVSPWRPPRTSATVHPSSANRCWTSWTPWSPNRLSWPSRGGDDGYRLLETIRQFAHDQMEAAGRAEGLQRRYALYFLDTLMRHVVALGESEHPTGFTGWRLSSTTSARHSSGCWPKI